VTFNGSDVVDALTPLDELKDLKFAVVSLAEVFSEAGSYRGAVFRSAVRGIDVRLDWVIRNLEAAGEGKRNKGV
jgi:hypothetical protein